MGDSLKQAQQNAYAVANKNRLVQTIEWIPACAGMTRFRQPLNYGWLATYYRKDIGHRALCPQPISQSSNS